MPKPLYNTTDIAKVWGVTPERVRQILAMGVITPDYVHGRQAFWIKIPVRPRAVRSTVWTV